MDKKKIIFCGTPNIGVKVLEAIIDKKKYEILFVITQPDKFVGRNKDVIFSPVKDFCIKNNIKIFQPKKIIELNEIILNSKPDLILTCAYGQFIPKSILEIPKYKCVNVHASLLPKYRGGAPIHWSLINGEKETGISLMYMEKEMDSGNIILQEKIDILFEDNLETLSLKMEKLAYKIIFSNINILFNKDLKSIKQNEIEVTFGFNIKRENEKINWKESSLKIYNLVRGLYKNPGSYTILDDKIVKIYKVNILNSKTENKKPGEIISIDKKGVFVSTIDNDILISEMQFEGKKIIKDNDIYNNRLKLIDKRFI